MGIQCMLSFFLSSFLSLALSLSVLKPSTAAFAGLNYVSDSILMLDVQLQVNTVSFSVWARGICSVMYTISVFPHCLTFGILPNTNKTKDKYLKHLWGMSHRTDNCCYWWRYQHKLNEVKRCREIDQPRCLTSQHKEADLDYCCGINELCWRKCIAHEY